jgi:hypothetical protein
VAAGTDLDSLSYVDEYQCDVCKRVYAADDLYRIQGAQVYKRGANQGYINADLCQVCLDTQPVISIVQGML